MKTILKYALPLAGIMMFVACGDDSSSSPAASGNKYILHEDKQTFGIIHDRCYVSESNTRWDENVDTSWYHYKFVGNKLVVFADGNTADKHYEWNGEEAEDSESSQVMAGGSKGNIFGTWKTTTERCRYEDGEIDCDNNKEDEESNSTIYVLDVSKSNLTMSWEMEKNYCPAEDLEYDIEDLLDYNDVEEYSVSTSDCNTVKFKANGKSVTATISMSIDKENVATREVTYTSGSKTCLSSFKKVSKMLQIPESLCNADDMSKYMKKAPGYPHKYQVDNDEEFYPCLSDMLGIEIEY